MVNVATVLLEHAFGYFVSMSLRAAVQYRVAEQLVDGPRTVDQLAQATGTYGPYLRTMLRLLASHGIFREDETGAFALTPLADALRGDAPHSQRMSVLLSTDGIGLRTAAALDETMRTEGAPFEKVHGAPFFEYAAAHPATAELFHLGMAASSAPENDAVAASYPFPDEGALVEIGGGRGGLLRSVLLRHPGLSGVLFDHPSAVGRHLLDIPELAGRWRVESGDFFTGVPPDGDVYMAKRVLHDWPDEDACRFLRSCRDAMAPGARLLIIDPVIPAGNDPHPGKLIDFLAMLYLGGKERTPDELGTLLTATGFRLARVLPTGTVVSIVEALAV